MKICAPKKGTRRLDSAHAEIRGRGAGDVIDDGRSMIYVIEHVAWARTEGEEWNVT
jgi:hypothetical protein